MGTDIHAVFQKKNQELGTWEDFEQKLWDEGRHYQLFAVLAGVRNGFGFAGVKLGDPVEPISEPRGFPEDFEVHSGEWHGTKVCPYDGEPRGDWLGDHTHSWLTGKEMLDAYETLPVVTKTGCITREVYEKWDKVSEPEYYCGAVMGPSIKTYGASGVGEDEWTHRYVEWQQGLKEELAYFFDAIKQLQEEHGEIRMVFGFDS